MATYSLPLCQRYTVSSSQPSAADDPVPLVSALLYTDKQVKARPGTCAALLDAHRHDPAFLVYTRQNLDGSDTLQDRPLNVRQVAGQPSCCAGRHVLHLQASVPGFSPLKARQTSSSRGILGAGLTWVLGSGCSSMHPTADLCFCNVICRLCFTLAGDWCDLHHCNQALCCAMDYVSHPAHCGIHMAGLCCVPAAKVSWKLSVPPGRSLCWLLTHGGSLQHT
jgi:hypothetical protein